jgi:hypothetical protein
MYSDAYIEPPLRAAVPTPKAPRKPLPARVRTRARIGGATAHNPPRRTEAPAERVRHSARRRAEKAARTSDNEVTAAVFHAPMSALNASAEENACAPKPHAVHADGKGSHGLRFRAQAEPAARARQRVRTQPIHHHRTLVHAYITPTDSHIYG